MKESGREAAKNRAFDCILNTKMLSNKILAQIFKQANGGQSKEIAARDSDRFTYDADQYEAALEEKFSEETFQENREIKRLQQLIGEKDKSIAVMRDRLEIQVREAGKPADSDLPEPAPVMSFEQSPATGQ